MFCLHILLNGVGNGVDYIVQWFYPKWDGRFYPVAASFATIGPGCPQYCLIYNMPPNQLHLCYHQPYGLSGAYMY